MSSFGGEGTDKGFYLAASLFLWGKERAFMMDYLIGGNHKIPDWLIIITFLLKVETAVLLDTKSRVGIMGFSTKRHHLGPVVFLFSTLV